MILDSQDIHHHDNLTTDVCIIGAGAAGISLAIELSRSNLAVLLLAGGRKRERSGDRDLYRGVIEPSHPHEPLEENRRRAFGGTTIAWGGRCIPLEPIDFASRSWIPDSGWPIAYSEVLPYFDRAMELCEAGPFSFDAADTFSPLTAPMIDRFDGQDVSTAGLERWSPPTNFAKRYASDLRRALHVRALLGGHATHVQLKENGSSVDHIRASARPGHEFFIRARAYVLAAGGLENPRLLLSSNDIHADGIGNSTGLVGRFYMSHLVGIAQPVRIEDRGPGFRYGFQKDRAGVYCRRRFALTPTAQTERQVGNAAATLDRPSIGEVGHRDPLFSTVFLVKQYGDIIRQRRFHFHGDEWREGSHVRREHWKVIAGTSPASTASLFRVFVQRYLTKRRLPMVLAAPSALEHHLQYQTEHTPNRASRIVLSRERDALGLPRITPKVAFSEVDFRTVVELHRAISTQLAATGTGYLRFDEDQIRDHAIEDVKRFNSIAHHLGTTRMSETRDNGVVDSNCKLHDVGDLFVVGGSVFPTGGNANPTLTIVAISVRLAAHLKSMLVR